ncbi:unnamed protein product, partial [Scytosiphon promiscuus]
MGALCLAGVVMNSGTMGGAGGSAGRSGASYGTALVPASEASAPASLSSRGGRRVLSADGGVEDDEDVLDDFANATGQSDSWVFHSVEAEPWRWRTTAARERRGPWVWERALNLFGNSAMAADHSRAGEENACNDDVVGVYTTKAAETTATTSEPQYPPIAPPAVPPLDDNTGGGGGGSGSGGGEDPSEVDGRIPRGHGSHEQARPAPEELSGKELDVFYRRGGGVGVGGRGGSGGGGGDDEGRVGQGFGPSAGAGVGAGVVAAAGMTPGGLPADRTSYMFCPEAHGMMSGGMIDRASKATYDHHHPGARPCPAPGSGGGGSGSRGGGAGGADYDGSGQLKVEVIDPRRERLRLLAGETPSRPSTAQAPADRHDHGDPSSQAAASAGPLALLSSSDSMKLATTRGGGGGGRDVYFGSDGRGRALGERGAGGGEN